MISTFQTLQVPIRDFVREFMLDSNNRNWLNKCSKNPSACVQGKNSQTHEILVYIMLQPVK